jgi:hypothetical protein
LTQLGRGDIDPLGGSLSGGADGPRTEHAPARGTWNREIVLGALAEEKV